MQRARILIFFLFIIIPSGVLAQHESICENLSKNAGTDMIIKTDSAVASIFFISGIQENAQIVYCPAGIDRSSPNDVKKRFPFEWTVKYNNVYIEDQYGIVIDGMNEHGFSASLMHLDKGRLPEKDKKLIPIASSLAVNFFIDHFKCIDTALLAIWDIRIFDDLGLDCGWPFRIVLHDSTGATAYIEYVDGRKEVYTPDAPAVIVEGPSYSRLLTIKHIPDSLASNNAEQRYLELEESLLSSNFPENIKGYVEHFRELEDVYFIMRAHNRITYTGANPDKKTIHVEFLDAEFAIDEEVRESLFE
jgi:hypothetical protein